MQESDTAEDRVMVLPEAITSLGARAWVGQHTGLGESVTAWHGRLATEHRDVCAKLLRATCLLSQSPKAKKRAFLLFCRPHPCGFLEDLQQQWLCPRAQRGKLAL